MFENIFYHPIANVIVKRAEIEGIEHEIGWQVSIKGKQRDKSKIDGQSVVIGNYVPIHLTSTTLSSWPLD